MRQWGRTGGWINSEKDVDSREGRHPSRGQEPRVPGGDHPGRRARAGRATGTRSSSRPTPASAPRSPTRTTSRPAPRSWPPPTTSGATGDLILKVKEPIARGVRPDARGPDPVHLPAPRRRPSRCTDALVERKVTGIAYETVELPDRSLPLLAPMSEVAGRLAPQVGAAHLMRAERRPRRADGRRLRRLRGQGRRHRRRRVRHERRRDRARHAGRGAAARPQHRPAAPGRRASTRATCRPSRPTPTRSSGRCSTPTWSSARCSCRAPRRRRWSRNELVVADEAGLGARRHLDRPGRLLRGLPADHARRPDLPGARLGLLLRGEHARRGAAHLDLRADQRHAALRRRAGQPRLARRAPRRPGAGPGPEHLRRRGHLRPGRRGARRCPAAVLAEVLA